MLKLKQSLFPCWMIQASLLAHQSSRATEVDARMVQEGLIEVTVELAFDISISRFRLAETTSPTTSLSEARVSSASFLFCSHSHIFCSNALTVASLASR
jgi:hypothetical protein